MLVSQRIFKIMDEKGITQKELAEQVGIGQSTISDWRRKKTDPASSKIMKIAKALGVTPEEILKDTI